MFDARADLEIAGAKPEGAGDAGDEVELGGQQHQPAQARRVGEEAHVERNAQKAAEDVDVEVATVPQQREAGVVGARGVAGVVERDAEHQGAAQVEAGVF